jgi:PAS domain S-box-containing protein
VKPVTANVTSENGSPELLSKERQRLIRLSLTLSMILSLLSIIFPLIGAAGWILRMPLLSQLHTTLPAMQPNTAVGLILCAIAVLVSLRNGRSLKYSSTVFSLGSLISLLGLVTLGEYAFGWDPGIDRIFLGQVSSDNQLFPGRPSPQAAMNFFLLGGVFLARSLRFRRHCRHSIAQLCALLAGANSLIVVTGYIFSAKLLYGFPLYAPAIGLALPTSIAFILLSIAVLFSRPNEGVMTLVTSDTRAGGIARRVVLSSFLIPPLVGALGKIGVVAGWYDVYVHISLFIILIVGLILRITWKAARQAEKEELRSNAAHRELFHANKLLTFAFEERQIFVALIENSSDFISIADSNGKIIYVNPSGRQMVGMPLDYPVENTRLLEYYSPEQRSFAADVIIKAMNEKDHWRGETCFRNWKTQESIPVSDEHFLIREEKTGRILGTGTVTRDISEAKQAQDRIREVQERFELALRGADLATWDWNIKTGEVSFNSRWAEMRGLLPEDVKPHVDFWIAGIHPEDLPRVKKALADYFEGIIQEYSTEFRVLNHSKEWIWILDRGKIFARDEHGSPTRMVGIERDITEPKILEQALQESHSNLSRAQSVAMIGSWRLDITRDRLIWSDENYRIFGIPPRTAVNYQTFLACVHPDDRSYVHQEWTAALAGKAYDIEHRIVVGDRIKWVREKADLEFDRTGKVSGGVGITQDITERRRLEVELRLSEAKASGIVSVSADAIISIDEDQRITLFNEGAERIFGYSKGEVIGAPIDILIPEKFRSIHRQHVDKFAMGKQVARRMGDRGSAISGRRKSGEEFPADAAISKIDVGYKRILSVFLRDITVQKRIENEQRFLADLGILLAKSLDLKATLESLLQLVVRDIAEMCIVYTSDEDGKIYRLKGATRDPSKGWICDLLVWSELIQRQANPISEAIDTRQTVVIGKVEPKMFESWTQNKEHLQVLRTIDPKSLLVTPLIAHGELRGAICIISLAATRVFTQTDLYLSEGIASRVALAIENARLYREAQRAKLITDNLPSLIAYWDKDQRCKFANQAYSDWFGFNPKKLVGTSMLDLLGAGLYEKNLPYIQGALSGTVQRFERDLKQHSTGEIRHTSATYIPEIIDGKVVGFFVLAFDVTDLKNAELNAATERDKAFDAVRTREEILAIVSHDLKNPLAAVSLSIQLLLKLNKLEGSQLQDFANRIQRSVSQMQTLIGDLLDFAKIQAGTFSVEIFRESLLGIVLPLREVFQSLADAKKLHLDVEISQQLSEVACDGSRIAQVISNLLGNAIKFTPEGGTVRLFAVETKGGVLVSVSDTGPGIPSEQLSKVFDRFWQAKETKHLGSGLGLSIAKGIIRAHHAKIWVESEVGKGSQFFFTLPLATSETRTRGVIPQPMPVALSDSQQESDKTVGEK